MNYLNELSPVFITLAFCALNVWTLKYFSTSIFLYQNKKKIIKIEAQISILRMSLKLHLRKKFNNANQYHNLPPATISLIQKIYLQNSELNLSDPHSYQLILNGLKEIHDHISNTEFGYTECMNKINTPRQTQSNLEHLSNDFKNVYFWEKLVESDALTLASIYDITTLTIELAYFITKYNSHVTKATQKYASTPDQIKIEHHVLMLQALQNKKATSMSEKADSREIQAKAA